ncbi:MAG: hypothetical protein II467_00775 [Bacilli bacterium]|jgi:hypothetical protein|nr:hypothetical protein [Bacilli bacterium]MBQ4255136.1 hypothetical protein [Bacilli bacterium]
MKKELLKGLTEEQIEKVRTCKTSDEILALAKKEGIELSDEQLQVVTGGSACITTPNECPKCGSRCINTDYGIGVGYLCKCEKCGHEWHVNFI